MAAVGMVKVPTRTAAAQTPHNDLRRPPTPSCRRTSRRVADRQGQVIGDGCCLRQPGAQLQQGQLRRARRPDPGGQCEQAGDEQRTAGGGYDLRQVPLRRADQPRRAPIQMERLPKGPDRCHEGPEHERVPVRGLGRHGPAQEVVRVALCLRLSPLPAPLARACASAHAAFTVASSYGGVWCCCAARTAASTRTPRRSSAPA